MDLKRVSLGYHRGSFKTAKRFYEEALTRSSEIDVQKVKPYIVTLLKQIQSLKSRNPERIAEDSQMLSTLFQNYARTYL